MLESLLFVFIGSGAGGTLRYLVSLWMEGYDETIALYATFVVNMLGAFGLACLLSYKDSANVHASILLFLGTGFFGGFTTYSTFNYEAYHLFTNGEWLTGGVYIFLTLGGALLGAILGGVVATSFV